MLKIIIMGIALSATVALAGCASVEVRQLDVNSERATEKHYQLKGVERECGYPASPGPGLRGGAYSFPEGTYTCKPRRSIRSILNWRRGSN